MTQAESIISFEVYLLETMKYGMLTKEQQRISKLGQHGYSQDDAVRIHRRIDAILRESSDQIGELRSLVGETGDGDGSLTYRSVLWPDFLFTASASSDNMLEVASYGKSVAQTSLASSPDEQGVWTMDVSEFSNQYGPIDLVRQYPLFDDYLPAHEWYEFSWSGRKYGAGFSWGLFLGASILWT